MPVFQTSVKFAKETGKIQISDKTSNRSIQEIKDVKKIQCQDPAVVVLVAVVDVKRGCSLIEFYRFI